MINLKKFTPKNNCFSLFFISDLHFDYIKRKENINDKQIKVVYETLDQIQDFISECHWNMNKNDLLIFLGDSFNNYEKTLAFINEVNEFKIKGFYVLGNHDYWNDGTKTYEEIENIFIKKTKKINFLNYFVKE